MSAILFAQAPPIVQGLASKPLLLVLLGFGGAVLLFAFFPQVGNFILGIFGKMIVDVANPPKEIKARLASQLQKLGQQPGAEDPSTPAGQAFAAVAETAQATNAAFPDGTILKGILGNPMILIVIIGGAILLMSGGGGCGGGGTGGCSMPKPTPTPAPKASNVSYSYPPLSIPVLQYDADEWANHPMLPGDWDSLVRHSG